MRTSDSAHSHPRPVALDGPRVPLFSMTMSADPLDLFHPVVRRWFAREMGDPTEVQSRVWPRIAAGEHILATAPTGSGKTLAAFLWALNQLLVGAWERGRVRVLYVSPLKALGNDVRRNLLEPLDRIAAGFREAGEAAAEVRVLVRSGDTPNEERQRMARHPPEILITTPESLNILLTSRRGRELLSGVVSVVLDEIHAVAGTKRGAHLITGVERLARVAGEFQRIALSATVRPLDRVAAWVGGFRRNGETLVPRPVAVIDARAPKRYELSVRFPGGVLDNPAAGADEPSPFWEAVAEELREPLRRNRSTLFFANSRRMVEKITRLLNRDEPEELVYSHHGSLSREIRAVVEERLKSGRLRGIVATNSLELGIDIGSLDEVVLVQTPPSLASAAQRIGRAGHAVGGTSRGRFVALAPRDLLQAAVAARAVLDGDTEALRPVTGALDVLAQVVVSMVATETWDVEDLFGLLRAADPYHDLPRRHFDLVLEMLAGRYSSTRIRELRPLVSIDRAEGTVRGRPGSERRVYLSGGTIPDRGYFHLRREGTGSLIGELDEEFVWERKVGDAFTLGVQSWRIERITHNDVVVSPVSGSGAMAPFWRAEPRNRGFELSERVGAFLEQAERDLGRPEFRARLASDHGLVTAAADALADYLATQKEAMGGILPHRHRLVIERVRDPAGVPDGRQVVLHTFWGGRVNFPFALALSAAWEERYGTGLDVFHDDDCVFLGTSREIDTRELATLVRSENLERLLEASLSRTGFFGARFREAAGIALLLPREGLHRRTPLWLSRLRAKSLLLAVNRFDDFPLRLEAWRACLGDALDLAALGELLDEVRDGRIEVREVATPVPSPFTAGVIWKRTNELMYENDAPAGPSASRPRTDLIRELVLTPRLRPRIPRAIAEEFERKLKRTFPGYSPRTPEDLLDWVEERIVVPLEEWRELLSAMERDHAIEAARLVEEITQKVAAVAAPGKTEPAFVSAVAVVPRLARALAIPTGDLRLFSAVAGQSSSRLEDRPVPVIARGGEGTAAAGEEEADPIVEILAEMLRFYGPVDPAMPATVLGLDLEASRAAIEALAESQRVVVDQILEDASDLEVCDGENLEALLRIARARARPVFKARPIAELPSFLASWQGLGAPAEGLSGLRDTLEKLFAYPAPVEAWEAEILPARLRGYVPSWLDALLSESGLEWLGCGERKIAFVLSSDRELVVESREQDRAGTRGSDEEASRDVRIASLDALIPRGPGRFGFEDLLAHSGLPSTELTRQLWRAVWRGLVSNDGYSAVRQGLVTSFEPAEAEPRESAGRRRRLRFDRWKSSRPFGGAWYRIDPAVGPADAIDREEANKDRVRLLLDRYGVLFRELLDRELPAFQWQQLFRTLRIMELSGEVAAGEFFEGVPGLQFASPAALACLREGQDEDRIWWMNAADPASPCGLGLQGLSGDLPRRLVTNHVVFRGQRCVAVSRRRGRDLDLRASPGDPGWVEHLAVLDALLVRAVDSMAMIVVDRINGEPAGSSPYRESLEARFRVTRDGGSLLLSRR